MWEGKTVSKDIDDYFDKDIKSTILKDLDGIDFIELVENSSSQKINSPYLTSIIIHKEYKYNPQYGDDKICECGDTYYRHFDSYENMSAIGCKYCSCNEFVEKAT